MSTLQRRSCAASRLTERQFKIQMCIEDWDAGSLSPHALHMRLRSAGMVLPEIVALFDMLNIAAPRQWVIADRRPCCPYCNKHGVSDD